MKPSLPAAGAAERIRFLIRSTEDPLAGDGPNVILNLTKNPKKISAVYVYDKIGTTLFERQCNTLEYYLRRVEARLLQAHAGEIIERCGFLPLVELGAGTAEKTRILLAEYAKRDMRCDYFPIDVDTETLFATAYLLAAGFPRLFVHCLGATYQESFRALPACPRGRLFLFLGSSLGNMDLQEIDELLAQLFCASLQGDYLLLGADLDKDPAIINSAYNDSAGYGARSTLNMLAHLNRRYGGNFVMDQFGYRSQYNCRMKRNEVSIESLADQTVNLANLSFCVSFGRSELIDAEVMWKFDPAELAATLDRAGFSVVNRWIDPIYRYGLFLSRRK
ncbi:MAG: L-histidine N(alpha)-methyltransferase [Steroidobacteraceae bacterium]